MWCQKAVSAVPVRVKLCQKCVSTVSSDYSGQLVDVVLDSKKKRIRTDQSLVGANLLVGTLLSIVQSQSSLFFAQTQSYFVDHLLITTLHIFLVL